MHRKANANVPILGGNHKVGISFDVFCVAFDRKRNQLMRLDKKKTSAKLSKRVRRNMLESL